MKQKEKSLKYGVYSIVVSIAVIAIVVLLNVAFSRLPSTYREVDLSEQRLATLSDATKDVLHSLNRDVTMKWIVRRGQEDPTVESLLNRYAATGGHIKLEKVDPDDRPTLSREYGIDMLYNNSVVVETDLRYRYVSYTQIYVTTTDYSRNDDGEQTTTFEGEQALTSAVHYVTTEKLPVAYALTGHGETELSDSFVKMILTLNVEMKTLAFEGTPTVPDDCDFLFVNTPVRDFTEAEADAVLAYLKKGGRMFLITLPIEVLNGGEERVNIGRVAAAYGLKELPGVIMEGDSNYYYSQAPIYYLLPDLVPHKTTDALINSGYAAFLPFCGAVTKTDDASADLTITELIRSSDKSYLKLGDGEIIEREEGDVGGPFSIALYSEAADESALLWVTSSYLPSEYCDTYSGGANSTLFLNFVNAVSRAEGSMEIGVKDLTERKLYVSASAKTIWTVALIGVAVLVIGVCVFVLVRRNRR